MTNPDPAFWMRRRVLVTGHTGFKGGWLSLWLARMGAIVTGYALPPEHLHGIYHAAQVGAQITPVTGDLKDRSRLRHCIDIVRPQIIFHLAAQALVRRAHRDPVGTYVTNVAGTAEVLEAARLFPFVRAIVVVTSDKVYENRDDGRAFREDDPLGGHEPYGISKAAAEMVVTAFRRSMGGDGPAVATVRAGNVIGGGDWGEDRLVPDAMRAFASGMPLQVRNPGSTRPWQHVLDPLCGYIQLAERLMGGDPAWQQAWNFGADESHPVGTLVEHMAARWNDTGLGPASWMSQPAVDAPYEARTLGLDSAQARDRLGWRPRLPLERALAWTVDWYAAQARGEPMLGPSAAMIDAYVGEP
jgi:CDP-glucose 4,6-dehydratase